MKMIATLALAFAAGLAAAPALAANVYECAFPEREANRNWLPAQVAITHDVESGEVLVFDPLIQHYKGNPIPAKVETDNKARVTYTWRLDGMKDVSGQMVNQAYRLTIRKDGLSAKVSGKALGYANSPDEAAGRCKLHKR